MNCPYCGAEVADGQAFCPVCGGSFNAPPEWDDVRRAKPRKQVNKKRALVCAADPAELPETQPSTAAPETSSAAPTAPEPSTAPNDMRRIPTNLQTKGIPKPWKER